MVVRVTLTVPEALSILVRLVFVVSVFVPEISSTLVQLVLVEP